MKTAPVVLLAAAIATAPYQVHPQEAPPADPKITSFLEGLCIGLVLGLTADALIIVGINCYHHHGSTNAPPVRPPEPPPTTNAPPATNSISGILRSGDNGATWYTNGAFQTILETQVDGGAWTDLYQIKGWPASTGAGWLILVNDTNGMPVLTNFAGPLQFLNLPMPTNGTARFLRLRAPND